MASVSTVTEKLEIAIRNLKYVKNFLLPELAIIDDNDASTASMIEFIEQRISELETLKADIKSNAEVAESMRSALGM